MAKTTLKPWLKEDILVDIESTEVLTPEEEGIVARTIRVSNQAWCILENCCTSTKEIKQAIYQTTPTLSSKLISINYRY